MGWPEIELKQIDRAEKISAADYSKFIGKEFSRFENEHQYQEWLLLHADILKRVIGISGDGDIKHNKRVFGTRLRPDIVFETKEYFYVLEVKCGREEHKSVSMTDQLAGIGQLLLYGVMHNKPTKLFLVDNYIHQETLMVVVKHNLQINIIEANERAFSILNYSSGVTGG